MGAIVPSWGWHNGMELFTQLMEAAKRTLDGIRDQMHSALNNVSASAPRPFNVQDVASWVLTRIKEEKLDPSDLGEMYYLVHKEYPEKPHEVILDVMERVKEILDSERDVSHLAMF